MPNRGLILIALVTEELRCTFLFTHCHRLKLCTVNHCHVVTHISLCWSVFKKRKAQRAGRQAGRQAGERAARIENPAIDVARLHLQHLDWLEFSASVRREDWHPACKFDSVLKMQRASCYWLNASILIIFPYVSLVDMKRSQATASGEVITSDKASILDLACAILHYLAKPNF